VRGAPPERFAIRFTRPADVGGREAALVQRGAANDDAACEELVREHQRMVVQLALNLLGGDVQVLSAVQGGTIDATAMNSGILQGQIKEFAIVDLPFLFNSPREADAVMDGPIGKELAAKLPEKGLIHLAYYELGFRNLTNSKHPVRSAADIAGLKIRVIQSPIYIDTFSALGANPVPMPFPEVYTALEQKTIDGQENPYSVIEANKFFEVQKYLSITRHVYNPQTLMFSKKTWDRLSKDEQAIIASAASESAGYQRKVARDASDQSLAALKKTMEVNEVSPAELTKIREKLKPVIDKYSAQVGPDLIARLYAEIAKARK